ncbi:hypothetical protein [[Phormidium ambiguum] IAM M-71]|uniref:hypothetical protein n=1 Tax=[Phormidium ambiguum] IAM M-71 TaxID=454136 RepID=UPI0011610FA4|nr:hypothetical protein [Phormidium ambiguum]
MIWLGSTTELAVFVSVGLLSEILLGKCEYIFSVFVRMRSLFLILKFLILRKIAEVGKFRLCYKVG